MQDFAKSPQISFDCFDVMLEEVGEIFKHMMLLFRDVDGEHTPSLMPSDHKQTHLESFISQSRKIVWD